MKVTIYDENARELASKEVDEDFVHVDFDEFDRKRLVKYFRLGDSELGLMFPQVEGGPGITVRLQNVKYQQSPRFVDRLEDRVDRLDARLERLERRLDGRERT